MVIAPVDRGDHLDPAARLDTAELASQLILTGTDAEACGSYEESFQILRRESNEPRSRPLVMTIFTNGSFGNIIEQLVKSIRD